MNWKKFVIKKKRKKKRPNKWIPICILIHHMFLIKLSNLVLIPKAEFENIAFIAKYIAWKAVFSNSFRGKLSIMGSHQSDKRNMYLQNPARSQASRMMPASSPHSNPYLTPQNRNMAAQQKWVFNNIDSNNGNKPRWMLIILISSRYMQTPASPAPKWTYLSPKIGRSNILSL